MRRHLGTTLLVAVFGGAVAAGCGGGDEDSLSKAEYIEQGDAICKKSDARLDKAGAVAFGKLGPNERPEPAELEAFARTVLAPEIRSQIKDLRALAAPEGDGARLDKLYDATENALKEVEVDPQLGLAVTDPFAAANKQAKDYGFKECDD